MRITHQMLTRNYLGRMNTNQRNLVTSNEKLSSGRAFNKGYENVADAGRALKVRKLIEDNERYQVAVRDSLGRAEVAETSLRTVNSLLIKVEDKLIEGMNGTMTQDDRDKVATEIEKLQDEVLQLMNGDFSKKYVFAAAGNEKGTAPFTVDDAGKLVYNGTTVSDIHKDPTTGKPSVYFSSTGVYRPIPYNEDNYVDIGYGYQIKNGKIDPNTAFKDTYSGVEAFGYGTNDDGVPLNAYELLGDMVQNLRTSNMDGMDKNLNAISDTMNYLLTSITEIGTRGTTLQDTLSNLESEYITLAETQNELEGVDLAGEMINNKSTEMSWLVTLQLGSKILPQTLFDFLR